jgi:hypothetical protein
VPTISIAGSVSVPLGLLRISLELALDPRRLALELFVLAPAVKFRRRCPEINASAGLVHEGDDKNDSHDADDPKQRRADLVRVHNDSSARRMPTIATTLAPTGEPASHLNGPAQEVVCLAHWPGSDKAHSYQIGVVRR